jgi:hypothetical protein
MGGLLLAVLFILIGTFSLAGMKPLPPDEAEKERREMRYLEQKIGECDARGGVARVDPISGYLGCDLPILRAAR